MLLLHAAYIAFCLGSVLGAILFMGFTFHVNIRYPLAIVIVHVTIIVISFILFSLWCFRALFHAPAAQNVVATSDSFLIVSFITFAVTLATGLFFFAGYDARRRQLRVPLIGTHIVLACLTFIAVTSLLGLTSPPSSAHPLYVSGRWNIIHRNEAIRKHFHD